MNTTEELNNGRTEERKNGETEGQMGQETEALKNRRTEERKQKSIFRFREFPVYQDARRFRKVLKELSKQHFPREEQYALTSQLWRALDSILLNIAEGAERYSDTDFSRFLNNALASVNEVAGCLDCALDDGYITAQIHADQLAKAENIARQLKAFCAKVRSTS
ncbi:MAG: four helix bundle protein [Candidatus Omnitrophota bacterium]|nr:four helix bundle protein [Candidatus Omnitrophota bacterium]